MSAKQESDGRRVRREENKQRTVESILDMMFETGEEPSIDSIVERSGVSRRSVFHYFNNKQMMIYEINNLLMDRISDRFAYPEIDTARSFSETLKQFLAVRVDIFEYIAPIRPIIEEKKRANAYLEENSSSLMAMEKELIYKTFSPYFPNLPECELEDIMLILSGCLSWNCWSFFRNDCQFTVEKSFNLIEKQILAISGSV